MGYDGRKMNERELMASFERGMKDPFEGCEPASYELLKATEAFSEAVRKNSKLRVLELQARFYQDD